MAYTTKDYAKLIGMPGFSETLLKNHFTLYQGYVTNTNKVSDALAAMLKDSKTAVPEFAELKRRLGWEFDGMRLHEVYFENLGGKSPLNPGGKLGKKMAESFRQLRGLGERLQGHRGDARHRLGRPLPGFGLRTSSSISGSTSMMPAIPPAASLLVMDVFEHAFMIDYGLKRADYIEAFFKNIDWTAAEARLK